MCGKNALYAFLLAIKNFVRLVQELGLKIFSHYLFSILLPKLLASTTNRTLDGDHGCGRYEKMRGCRNELCGWAGASDRSLADRSNYKSVFCPRCEGPLHHESGSWLLVPDGKLDWHRQDSDKSTRYRHNGGIRSGTGDLLITKHETGRRRMNPAIHLPRKESATKTLFPWESEARRTDSEIC